MLTPRFNFTGDYSSFEAYFRAHPHTVRHFSKGEYLWKPGQPYDRVHYYMSGASVCFAEHQSGRRKLISFHGPGTIFPGYHTTFFKIELSLLTMALCETSVLEFSIDTFQTMFRSNPDVADTVVNWYAKYVNRFLFETIHQEFNPSRVKMCNLLYLLAKSKSANGRAARAPTVVDITQQDLADLLGMSRVQVTRVLTWLRGQGILATARGRITVLDLPALAALCTDETGFDSNLRSQRAQF